jgi:hypothetical protein
LALWDALELKEAIDGMAASDLVEFAGQRLRRARRPAANQFPDQKFPLQLIKATVCETHRQPNCSRRWQCSAVRR